MNLVRVKLNAVASVPVWDRNFNYNNTGSRRNFNICLYSTFHVSMIMATFYREAAFILKRLEKRKGSLKSLIFPARKRTACISYRKKLYALTSQTLKCENPNVYHKSINCTDFSPTRQACD